MLAEVDGRVPDAVGPLGRFVARDEEDDREPRRRAARGARPRSPSRRTSGSRAGREAPARRAACSGSSAAGRRAAADPLGERRAVEPVEAERLGRRAARGPALDAEDGDRAALELAPERVPEAAHRRVVLEHEHVLERLDLGREPLRVEAVEPRHAHDPQRDPLVLGEELGGEQRLVEQHGPYASSTASCPSRSTAPRPARARSRRKLDPARRGTDREADRDALVRILDRPAHERPRLLRVRRLHDREPGERAEQRDVAHALVRLPGPGRNQARVVERVDDPRALARLVVDLLVRARGEERGEGVDHRQEAVAREAGRGRDQVLLRDPALDEAVRVRELEAADAAVGGEVGVEHEHVGRVSAELEERFAVRVHDVLVRRPPSARTRTAPARPRGCRGRAFLVVGRLVGRRVEAERGEPFLDARASSATASSNGSAAGAPACQRYVPPPVLERARMLHERDALALDRPRDERLRRVVLLAEAREDVAQRGVVVPVAGLDRPAERAQLRLQVAERDDLLRRLVGLELVAVDDDPETAEPLVRRALQRLPVLPFLELAVAGHDDDAAAVPGEPLRERDPAPLGDPHAERARVRLDARARRRPGARRGRRAGAAAGTAPAGSTPSAKSAA